jgi:delta14-sterol reductase
MPPSNSSVTNGDITITKSTAKELNPRSKPTEFLGPAGTTVVTFLTPLMAYLLFFGCNPTTGCPSLSLETYKVGFQNGWPAINGKLWDWGAAGVYAGWYAFTVICWNILPGEQVEGTLLRDGKRKKYNLNGKSQTAQIWNIG